MAVGIFYVWLDVIDRRSVGEIRSALDLLSQHVFRVDNIVKGTDLLASMQATVRSVVKTQARRGSEA